MQYGGSFFVFDLIPCEKRRKKRGQDFLGGDGCWELFAVWNALARDHVLLLGARQQTKWSGGRGRHSGPLGNGNLVWGVGNPKSNRPFVAALFSGRW